MVNMKLSNSIMAEEATPVDSQSLYPYGLCINLKEESLSKLGIETLPEVGTKMKVTAEVIVVSVRSEQEQDGDMERSVELQITDMEISKISKTESKAGKPPEEALYG